MRTVCKSVLIVVLLGGMLLAAEGGMVISGQAYNKTKLIPNKEFALIPLHNASVRLSELRVIYRQYSTAIDNARKAEREMNEEISRTVNNFKSTPGYGGNVNDAIKSIKLSYNRTIKAHRDEAKTRREQFDRKHKELIKFCRDSGVVIAKTNPGGKYETPVTGAGEYCAVFFAAETLNSVTSYLVFPVQIKDDVLEYKLKVEDDDYKFDFGGK